MKNKDTVSNFQADVNLTVHSFVAQISELARRAALDTLESTLGSPSVSIGNKTAAARGPSGIKRSPDDLEALATKFVTFVKKQPGLRIEQINKELGTSTKDLALPIRKLISEGFVSVKGKKRSTTYFPGKKTKN